MKEKAREREREREGLLRVHCCEGKMSTLFDIHIAVRINGEREIGGGGEGVRDGERKERGRKGNGRDRWTRTNMQVP
jgi:hypothetical protein